MTLKVSLVAMVCVVFLASTVRSHPRRITREANAEPDSGEKYPPPMDYRFRYEVKDEPSTNFQNRIEISKDGIVRGSYSLLSPDGILRTTVYSDKGEGYKVTLHEEPTDIIVIGSGVAGDPLSSHEQGSGYSNREKSSQAFQSLGGYPFDFEDFSGFSSLEKSKERRPSNYRKSKQKNKSHYGTRDSEEESSIFIASTSPHSSHRTSSIKDSSHSALFVSGGLSSKGKQEIPSIPIDQETFTSLDQDELVTVIQEKIKEKIDEGQKYKHKEIDDETREDELDQDGRPEVEETESDDFPDSKLDVPIIAIDQGLFDSLSLPESTFRQQDLVLAIQKAAQKAQGHTQSSTVGSRGRVVGLTDSRRSQAKGGYGFENENASKEDDSVIPLITINQSILDSLFLPSKDLNQKELMLAIQEAAKAALSSDQSDAVSHSLSSKDKITQELNIKNKGEGEIPLIALEKSHFDRLSLPGSTFDQGDLATAIQKATQAALKLKDSASGPSKVGSSFSSPKIKEENKITKAEASLSSTDPGSPSVFVKLSDNKATEGKRGEAVKSGVTSEGEIPIIAIEQNVFDALSLPGSTYTQSDLLAAIQQAAEAALKPIQSHSPSSQSSGIDTTRGKIDEKSSLFVSKDQGAKNSEIPVIAVDQSASTSPFKPKSAFKLNELSGTFPQATHTALGPSGVSSSSGSSTLGGETASQVTQRQKDSSSSASTLGLTSGGDSSISEGNIPIVVLERNLFDALPAQGKTELLSALQQATQVAIGSGSEATGGQGERTKIKAEQEKVSSSSFSSSSSSGFGASTSLDSGSAITHSEGTATTDGIIPVIALEQTKFNSMSAKEKSKLISSIQEAAQTIFNQPSSSTINRDSKVDSSKLNSNIGFSSSSTSSDRAIPVLALNKKLFDLMPTQQKNELLSEIKQVTQATIGTSELSTSPNHLGGENISPSFISSTTSGSKTGLESSSSAISLHENLASGNNIPIIALEQAIFDSMSLQEKNQLLASIKKATEFALGHPESSKKSTSKFREISSGGSASAAINFEKKAISGPEIPVVAVDKTLFNSMSAHDKSNLVAAIQQATLKAVTGGDTGSARSNALVIKSRENKANHLDINDPSRNFVNPSEVTPAEVDLSNAVTQASNHIDFGQGVFEAFQQLTKEAAFTTESSNLQTKVDEGLLESVSPQLSQISQSNRQSKQHFEELGFGLQAVDVPLGRNNNINSNTLSSFTNSVSEFKEMHNKMVNPVSRA